MCQWRLLHSRNMYTRTEISAVMSPSLTTSGDACVKCGTTKKQGRHSCCARGGTWFKNCGGAGDSQFGHTWSEGVQACKDFPTLVNKSLKVVHGHVGFFSNSQNVSRSNRFTDQDKNMRRAPNVGIIGFKDSVGLANALVWICTFFLLF